MDPISVFASVIAIATATIQTSSQFYALVNSVKNCSEDIHSISRDVQGLHSIICSLHALVTDAEMRQIISSDDSIVQMIENLQVTLDSRQELLRQLASKLTKSMGSVSSGKQPWLSRANVKWGLYTKTEVKNLQLRLEAVKSTLGTALDSITA